MNKTAVLLMDLACVRFRFGPGNKTISAVTSAGLHLGTIAVGKNVSQAQAAYLVLCDIRQSSTLLAADPQTGIASACRVGFYNPFTLEVSVCLPDEEKSLVFRDVQLELPTSGKVVLVTPENLTDPDSGRVWLPGKLDMRQLSRNLASHATI